MSAGIDNLSVLVRWFKRHSGGEYQSSGKLVLIYDHVNQQTMLANMSVQSVKGNMPKMAICREYRQLRECTIYQIIRRSTC